VEEEPKAEEAVAEVEEELPKSKDNK